MFGGPSRPGRVCRRAPASLFATKPEGSRRLQEGGSLREWEEAAAIRRQSDSCTTALQGPAGAAARPDLQAICGNLPRDWQHSRDVA